MGGKMSGKLINIAGNKYNMLTVIEYDYDLKKWKCKCDCGNVVFIKSQNITSQNTKSCGCFFKSKQHGMKYTDR